MKRLIIILAVLIVVLGAIVLVLFFSHQSTNTTSSAQTGTTASSSVTFPASQNTNSGSSSSGSTNSNSSQNLEVKGTDGSTIVVDNFETDRKTVKDPTNDGYYYLSGGSNVSTTKAPYQIFYDSQDQYFGITLYQEPLGQYRTQAEDELIQDLGLTQDQMCSLNYDISVGQGVNDTYLGENLGFSFCPGAVALP
jgi:hypothetical protein